MRAPRAAAATLFLLLAAASAVSQSLPDKVWAVGVFEAPPYAVKAGAEWQGLSVELWKELARDLGLTYRFVELAPDAVLDGVSRGRLDIAAAPFASTLDRQQVLDFTHAYRRSGLAVAVRRAGPVRGLVDAVLAFARSGAAHLFGVLALLTLLFGAALWLTERRRNPEFQGSRLEGLGDGFWWASVTASGVGYGDKVPRTARGRVVAVAWIAVSIVVYALLTAAVTANLALSQMSDVRGLSTLKRSVAGTLEGTESADYLRTQQIRHRLYASLSAAARALEAGEIDALVYEQESLRALASRPDGSRLDVLPDPLETVQLAFPVPDGSPLRAPIDRELRTILVAPRWRDLVDRYLTAAAPGRR